MRDLDEIIRLYSQYDSDGQLWQPAGEKPDYKPTVKRTNYIKQLIEKEGRFMMGIEPEINIIAKDSKDNGQAVEIEKWLSNLLIITGFGDKVF